MPANHHLEERDDLGPLSPNIKRRRFDGDNHQPTIHRVMPPRYANVPTGTPVGPGTPFPFSQAPNVHQAMYSPGTAPGSSHSRRESLPALRGVVNTPGPMAPPPRPGPGYQQHRMSQGHIVHDRSLQLPPLQTGVSSGIPGSAKTTGVQSIEEVIMNMPFEAKLAILRKISPPKALKKSIPRGPLIAIEGDNAGAVNDLAKWLSDTLSKDSELSVRLLDGPDVAAKDEIDNSMAEYHMLVAQWLGKSKEILTALEYGTSTTPPETAKSTRMGISETTSPAPQIAGTDEVNGNRNGDEDTTPTKSNPSDPSTTKKASLTDIMDVDKTPIITSNTTTKQPKKPIAILPLFSLHASNTFACRIPLTDTYAPNDHWSWNATQWRGVVGPDLTIYLKDGEEGGSKAVQQSEEEMLFVVKRGAEGVDGATLRRVGFEVGEWARAFGAGR